ncbi:MAG: hypothetical protein ACQER9_02825 [Nanobdellota archaeon]
MAQGKKEKPQLADKKKVEELLEKKYFQARTIVEIMGKPEEHVKETMDAFILKASKDPRFTFSDYSIESPQKLEDSESLYSSFAEIEFLTKDSLTLMNFVMDYMPTSIEVIEPSNINVQASYMSNLLTELAGRIHTIDNKLKKEASTNKIITKSLNVMIQNSILILLNLGPRKLENISKSIGVQKDQAEPFLKKLVNDKKIDYNKDNNTYRLIK